MRHRDRSRSAILAFLGDWIEGDKFAKMAVVPIGSLIVADIVLKVDYCSGYDGCHVSAGTRSVDFESLQCKNGVSSC